ncbi:DUF2784 domain-containing protein [Rhodococcus chondri]|uniref:DUF2784 domain-containing protein n=1 Tax=Rhodococcus chondri TaxID=3065941 RepID=A0ABU7JSK2_9NOCA|nr:DUF2784 domain-containing protein [Rhodococcus sp. CC-R104]MEE2032998.1 DUF2784 domain-containing protein [Rhodococcus sp. CC-R104]
MTYRVLADATALTHLLFVLYVTFGGFLTWHWPRTILAHVPAVVWGGASVIVGFDCPLTTVENWARRQAGVAGLPPSGFIDHYLTGVIYPESAIGLVRALVLLCVVGSWIGLWLRHRRGRRNLAPGLTRQ